MAKAKVSLGQSTYVFKCKSGKSFVADTEDHGRINVPDWAVHDDSEVYRKGDEGELIVLESWAEKQGML